MKKLTIIALLMQVIIYAGYAQFSIEYTIGFGMPEFVNTGLKIGTKAVQFEGTYGVHHNNFRDGYAVMAGVYVPVAGLIKERNRKPFYLKTSLSWIEYENAKMKEQASYFDLRLGYDFTKTNKFGVTLDVGIMKELYYDVIEKDPNDYWNFDIDFDYLPCAGIKLYYHLNAN